MIRKRKPWQKPKTDFFQKWVILSKLGGRGCCQFKFSPRLTLLREQRGLLTDVSKCNYFVYNQLAKWHFKCFVFKVIEDMLVR